MADEIIQRLGFDTGDSITNINLLKTSLDSLNTALAASATALRTFNTSSAGIDGALASLTGKVDAMVAKLSGMGNITPKIDLDTTGALSQINQLTRAWGSIGATGQEKAAQMQFASLKASLADYVSTNKISADQVNKAFAGTLSGSGAAINGLKTKVGEMQQAFLNLGQGAQSAGTKFGSFVTMIGRIIAIRAIISTLNDIAQAMEEGVQSASEFSLRLSQIAAIQDGVAMATAKLRAELLATSVEFARPIGETSIAFYQMMQNQVGTAAQSLGVFKAAATLAAANNAPLTDSVNLLTSALKGWNLSTDEAGRLAGMFFEAIKIGRMEASDLAETLGKIGPTAKAMGISVQESMAAVAVMTQQGTKANTAMTQLSAVMTALMKPTKELKIAMAEKWGVANAEEALVLFGGLGGVLQNLESITGGTSDNMIKFTANVRALRTMFALSGGNAKAYGDALNQLTEAEYSTAEAAAKLALESPGGQFKQSTVELANAWEEVGNKLLGTRTVINEIKATLVTMFGTSETLIAAAVVAVGALVLAWKSYVPAILAASKATALFGVALRAAFPIVGIVVAIGASFIALTNIIERNSYKTRDYFNSLEVGAKKAEEALNAVTQKRIQAETAAQTKLYQESLKSSSAIIKTHKDEASEARITALATYQTGKRYVDALLESKRSALNKAIDAENIAAEKILTIRQNMTLRAGKISDMTFEHGIKYNTDTTDKAELARKQASYGWSLKQQALNDLERAKTPADLELINDKLDRAKAYAEKAEQTTDDVKDAERWSRQSISTEKAKNIVQEKSIELTKENAAKAKAGIPKQIADIQKLTEFADTLTESLKEVKLDSGKWEDACRKMQLAFKGVIDTVQGAEFKPEDMLGTSKAENAATAKIKELKDVQASLQSQMTTIGEKTKVTLETKEATTKLGELNAQIQESKARLGEISKEYNKVTSVITEGASKLAGSGGTLFEWLDRFKSMPDLAPQATKVQEALKILTDSATTLNPAELKAKVLEYSTALADLYSTMGPKGTATQKNFDGLTTSLNEALTRLKTLANDNPVEIKAKLVSAESEFAGISEKLRTQNQEDINRSYQRGVDLENEMGRAIDNSIKKQEILRTKINETNKQQLPRIVDQVGKESTTGKSGIITNPFISPKVDPKALDAIKLDISTEVDKTSAALDPIDVSVDEAAFAQSTTGLQNAIIPLTESLNTVKLAGDTIPQGIDQAINSSVPALTAACTTSAASVQLSFVSAFAAIGNAIQEDIRLANQLATTSAQSAAFGGVIHRAAGGPVSRWTDTVSAMLTPGEVVMNTAASKRFYPQLQAMNAGSQPMFRDRGGSVTNVGDVNVTVNGGSTESQTIKNIAYGLRREIRRGTVKLN